MKTVSEPAKGKKAETSRRNPKKESGEPVAALQGYKYMPT
jgi:hypothetical protein